jgi:hypothetical protein
MAVIDEKDSRLDDNEPATDNAVSSIGKIMLHFPQLLMPPTAAAGGSPASPEGKRPDIKPEFMLPKLLPKWLSFLPCVGDEEEAAVVHNQMCLFLERYTPLSWLLLGFPPFHSLTSVMMRRLRPSYMPLLMGANNSNLPKVVQVVADVVDTNLLLEDTQKRLLVIVNKIFAALPAQHKTMLWNTLSANQRNRISKYVNAA